MLEGVRCTYLMLVWRRLIKDDKKSLKPILFGGIDVEIYIIETRWDQQVFGYLNAIEHVL